MANSRLLSCGYTVSKFSYWATCAPTTVIITITISITIIINCTQED